MMVGPAVAFGKGMDEGVCFKIIKDIQRNTDPINHTNMSLFVFFLIFPSPFPSNYGPLFGK